MNANAAGRHGYIVTFATIRSDRPIIADALYEALHAAGRWYVRRPIALESGAVIFFYRNGAGIVGHGVIDGASPVTTASDDRQLIERLNLQGFQLRIAVRNWKTCAQPFDIRAIVDDLDFVKNKKSWGSSLQGSPVRIPAHDVSILLARMAATSP